jgi:hypothetical protein
MAGGKEDGFDIRAGEGTRDRTRKSGGVNGDKRQPQKKGKPKGEESLGAEFVYNVCLAASLFDLKFQGSGGHGWLEYFVAGTLGRVSEWMILRLVMGLTEKAPRGK